MSNNKFSTVEEAIAAIKAGKMVIVADDEDRENEGDLVCAAESITPDMINFMATEARGLICMPVSKEIGQRLDLHPMTAVNTDKEGTAFTVSIDGSPHMGVSTGISAADRAKTIQICTEESTRPEDLRRPGHIFPLIARDGGVLVRCGQTEASVDLSKMAGLKPAAVICEIANEDGSMARRDELFEFAEKHNMPFITVAQMVEYRLRTETLIDKQAVAKLPTKFGEFKVHAYTEKYTGSECLALVYGDIDNTKPVHVRLHSECLTGDALSSLRCDCQSQLHDSQKKIVEAGSGILIYLRQEGRGIGLVNKMRAYEIQDNQNLDTYAANHQLGFQDDLRDFWSAAHILKEFDVKEVKLITNNPNKIASLEKFGIDVVDRISTSFINEHNKDYIQAKRDQHQHMI